MKEVTMIDLVGSCFLTLIATFIITGSTVHHRVDKYWNKEAVKRGYGEFKIDSEQKVYFIWKEPKP